MRINKNLVGILFLSCLQTGLIGQQWPIKEWLSATPQSQSMSADSLKAFDEAIVSGKYGYIDGVVITRHGKLVYQKKYKHDYDKIYGSDARKKSGLNALDPGGPYNYYNPWWHPYYRRGDLPVCSLLQKLLRRLLSV